MINFVIQFNISNFMKDHKVRAILINLNRVTEIGTINIVVYCYTLNNQKQPVYFPTNIKVAKKYFNNGFVKGLKESDKINSQIRNEITKIEEQILILKTKNIFINKENLLKLKEKSSYSNANLIELIEYAKDYKVENAKTQNTNVYNSLILNLREFQKANKNKVLTVEDINQAFINSLIKYFIRGSLKGSTIKNYLVHLKSAFKILYNQSIISDTFAKLDYTVKTYTTDLPTLNWPEINTLRKAKMTLKTDEKVRIKFLIQLFTGLRYSDLNQIKPDNFSNNKILIFTEKNEVGIQIPIHEFLNETLKLVDYDVSNLEISINHFNIVIKRIFKKLKLNRPIQTLEENNNLVITKNKPLYDVISSHVARRTAITLLYEMKLDKDEIKAITGHKDNNSLSRYIKISEDSKVRMMNNYSNLFKSNENN